MEKLKMHSRDNVAAHVEAVGRLFPNALTEVMRDGKAVQAIDFDVLRQELAREIVEGREERYAFTWPDKRQAILAANAPIAMTLRPIVEALLADDGVIFISIDDNEVHNLRKICDEIFGEANALTPFIWPLPRGINAGHIARAHEYILVYVKNIEKRRKFNKPDEIGKLSIERCNKKIDNRHPESTITFPAGIPYDGRDQVIEGEIGGVEKISIEGKMVFRDGKLAEPVTLSAGWTMKNMILDWLDGKKIHDLLGQEVVGFFFKENGRLYSQKVTSTTSIKSILKGVPDTQDARKEMESLFGTQDLFSYPKTTHLARLFAKLSTNPTDTVLDFFSGSATTAHAMMQLNAEDGGHRKFIMVQLPEVTDEKSEAYRAGYRNICEIGKERIRRAGAKIAAEAGEKAAGLDRGFRCLRLDTSNMTDVYYAPDAVTQDGLFAQVDNVKADRTPEDLLFQTMLDLGILLSEPITVEEIAGKRVFNVADGFLLACFDRDVTDEAVTAIAKRKPYYAVFRDASMADDSALTNFDQLFAAYSPATVRKVL